jgi:hypothetical protein
MRNTVTVVDKRPVIEADGIDRQFVAVEMADRFVVPGWRRMRGIGTSM